MAADGPLIASLIRHVGQIEEYLATNLAEREAKSGRDGIQVHVGQVRAADCI